MSYMRFSSDNYQCDFYAYETREGFMLHTASSRYIGIIPPPEPENPTSEDRAVMHKAIMEQVNDAKVEPINHEQAGKDFFFETEDELFSFIEELRKEGFRVSDKLMKRD